MYSFKKRDKQKKDKGKRAKLPALQVILNFWLPLGGPNVRTMALCHDSLTQYFCSCLQHSDCREWITSNLVLIGINFCTSYLFPLDNLPLNLVIYGDDHFFTSGFSWSAGWFLYLDWFSLHFLMCVGQLIYLLWSNGLVWCHISGD